MHGCHVSLWHYNKAASRQCKKGPQIMLLLLLLHDPQLLLWLTCSSLGCSAAASLLLSAAAAASAAGASLLLAAAASFPAAAASAASCCLACKKHTKTPSTAAMIQKFIRLQHTDSTHNTMCCPGLGRATHHEFQPKGLNTHSVQQSLSKHSDHHHHHQQQQQQRQQQRTFSAASASSSASSFLAASVPLAFSTMGVTTSALNCKATAQHAAARH
jgi:hypothetical protein